MTWPLPADRAEPDPAYRAVLDWVWSFSATPRSPEAVAQQRALKLDRMRALLAALGEPQRAFASVLVAGTKGKGSTVAMIGSCLLAAGRRVGRYTSPHLVNWRERVWVEGRPIGTDEVVALAATIRPAVEALPEALGRPNTFEVGTAFAFLEFARRRLEVAVVEVGVGGRLDATNVLEPLVSVITPISYDHTQTLGPTLADIAGHKAGVLRRDRVGVIAPQRPEARAVVAAEAAAVGARLEWLGQDWCWTPAASGAFVVHDKREAGWSLEARLPLLGDHQRDNATAAVAAVRAVGRAAPDLAVADDALRRGLAVVEWPGRLQVLRHAPLVVVDGAQNGGSAEVLRRAIESTFRYRELHLVLGVSAGKDTGGILRALAPLAARVTLTRSHHERAEDPAALRAALARLAPGLPATLAPDPATAIDAAVATADPRDLVLVTGSLFLVGEALLWQRQRA
jgi:dihydrofolate synthase / folylpolyglutamate synthase